MEPGIGPTNIEREQRRRQAKIDVELSDRPLGDVTNDVETAMATVQMPPNFEWGFLGDVELMQESAAAMGLAHAARGRLHLHRARVAVRVVLRAVPHHAVAAARGRRRAAGDPADRQQPRHAGR